MHHSSSKNSLKRKQRTDRTQAEATGTESRYRSTASQTPVTNPISSKESTTRRRLRKERGPSFIPVGPSSAPLQESEADVDCVSPQVATSPSNDTPRKGSGSSRSKSNSSKRRHVTSSQKRSRKSSRPNASSAANNTVRLRKLRTRSKENRRKGSATPLTSVTTTIGTAEPSSMKRKSSTKRKKHKDIDSSRGPPTTSPLIPATVKAREQRQQRELDGDRGGDGASPIAKEKEAQKAIDHDDSSSSNSPPKEDQAKTPEKPRSNKATASPQPTDKKDSKASSKNKKKNKSQDTENAPTVFESVDAPIKPMVENLPVNKIETTNEIPKTGTGEAKNLIDETPTARLPPKRKPKKKDGDDSDSNKSTYLPFYAAYK